MNSTEKDILIEKIKKMPQEYVEKILIFIAGLEAGKNISDHCTSSESFSIKTEK